MLSNIMLNYIFNIQYKIIKIIKIKQKIIKDLNSFTNL